MNRPATCRGCGEVVDLDHGANRGPGHGGITNFYTGTTVYCYATRMWERADPIEITQADGTVEMPWLDKAVRGAADRERRLMELNAWWAIPRSLRPRLRWAARRRRALRLLKWLRLWTPPTIYVGVDPARDGPRDLHFVTSIHRVPEKMMWDPKRMRIVEADE